MLPALCVRGKSQNNRSLLGWSVTVAGNYHPQLAPDVEMRLSFPKTQNDAILPQAPPSTATTNRDFYETPPTGASEARQRAALPPTGANPLNPKRTLTKVTPAPSGIESMGFFLCMCLNLNIS